MSFDVRSPSAPARPEASPWLSIWTAFAAGRSGLVTGTRGRDLLATALRGPLLELARLGAPRQDGPQLLCLAPCPSSADGFDLALAAAATGPLPRTVVTSPEGLADLCARADAAERLAAVRAVVIDSWDELAYGKRGVLVQLLLSRLRWLIPELRTWAVAGPTPDAATLARALVPPGVEPVVVAAGPALRPRLATLLPETVDALPWTGCLDGTMLLRVAEALGTGDDSLVVTDTEEIAELWRTALTALRPELPGLEIAAAAPELPVEHPDVRRVFRVGAPSGPEELAAWARPGLTMTCVPTQALQLLEIAALRLRLEGAGESERPLPAGTTDVLAFYLLSCAAGPGGAAGEMYEHVRATAAYADLDAAAFARALALVTTGGPVLDACPDLRGARPALTDAFSAAAAASPRTGTTLRRLIGELARGLPATSPEAYAATPLLEAQARSSHLPAAGELLLETWSTRDGTTLFAHPFAGRVVHTALGALLALRLWRLTGAPVTATPGDHGFALTGLPLTVLRQQLTPELFSAVQLPEDLAEALDLARRARPAFDASARLAGLVPTPGLYARLGRFAPDHPLLVEARAATLAALTGGDQLAETVAWCARATWVWQELRTPSPLALPLVVEPLRDRLDPLALAERVARLTEALAQGRPQRPRSRRSRGHLQVLSLVPSLPP